LDVNRREFLKITAGAGNSEESMAKRSKKRCEELPILRPHAAGIDVSASELFVVVCADRDLNLSAVSQPSLVI
jgi:hypothetical protein